MHLLLVLLDAVGYRYIDLEK